MDKAYFQSLVLARAKSAEPVLRRLAEVERLNAEDIAARLKITGPTVHKYAALLGINLVRKPHPEANYQKDTWLPIVRRLRGQGKNWTEIAKALGCSRITANRFGMQHGLNTHNPRRHNTGEIF